MSTIYAPEIYRIDTRHLTGFDLTYPQPTPPSRREIDKAAEIVIRQIAEQCHADDHAGRARNLSLIRALVVVDLGGPILSEIHLGDLVQAWPWDGEFPTAEARDYYADRVRRYLRAQGFHGGL